MILYELGPEKHSLAEQGGFVKSMVLGCVRRHLPKSLGCPGNCGRRGFFCAAPLRPCNEHLGPRSPDLGKLHPEPPGD